MFHRGTGYKWLRPAILAALEAEMGKIAFPGQSRQKVSETTISTEESLASWCRSIIPVVADGPG
jgi:hypothetical protein